MKFGEHLLTQAKPEWREKHINYELLKAILYRRRGDIGEPREEEFFKSCAEELKKINAFFQQKAVECVRKCQALEQQVNPAAKPENPAPLKGKGFATRVRSTIRRIFRRGGSVKGAATPEHNMPQLSPEKERELKAVSEEFYYELECLKKYQDDNMTGFRKILKKHDKMWSNKRGENWYERKVCKAKFAVDNGVSVLCQRVEQFRIQLERGDRKKAMAKLRVPTISVRRASGVAFLGGFFWGISLSAVVITILSAFYTPLWQDPPWVTLRLYRGYWLVLFNATLFAWNLVIWRSNGINYVLIFELNPRKHLTGEELFAIVAGFLALWSVSLLGYVSAPWLGLPRLYFPLILTAIYLLLMLNPLPFAFRDPRYWFIRRLWSCLTAPFQNGTFADFWIANYLTTLSTALLDMHFLICMYAFEVHYEDGWMYFKVKNYSEPSGNMTTYNDFVNDDHWGIDPKSGNGFCTSDAYGIRPIINLLPAAIRLMQSLRRYRDSKLAFPHLYNVAKYSCYFPMGIFRSLYKWHSHKMPSNAKSVSPYFHLWMFFTALRYAYSMYWDVRVDWRLLSKRSTHRFLREKLLYSAVWIYYTAATANAIIRYRWVPQTSLQHAYLVIVSGEVLSTVSAVLDSLRRFIWAIIRMENEQLNNVEHLRVTRRTFAVPFKKLDDFGNMLKQSASQDAKEASASKLKKKAKKSKKSEKSEKKKKSKKSKKSKKNKTSTRTLSSGTSSSTVK